MARYIVLVIDSYGIGAMEDGRAEDQGANTYLHVFEKNPHLKLPHLEQLGLGNIADPDCRFLKHIPNASYGSSLLKHWGADTFLGHQEILGTTPLAPVIQPFSQEIDNIQSVLEQSGYSVRRYGNNLSVLVVNNAAVIGDNLETDLGQNYNVTSAFDLMSYEDTCKLGKLVRQHVSSNRVIAFGAPGISFAQILDAYQEIDHRYAGVSAPGSGVYKEGYRVLHLGYGINHQEQVPYILGEQNIPSILIGKVADIAENHPLGESYGELVDSNTIFDIAIEKIKKYPHAFFCINIQETDLAGHSQDATRYANILEIVDRRIKDIMNIMNPEDLLILTADHGNDPTIGHSKHTREKVPILLYGDSINNLQIRERKSLSDIGASACSFFGSNLFPPNGESF
ncbi:MAG: phosphopentomutase, partial [Brevinema sp.]